jgi:hypothetical protein
MLLTSKPQTAVYWVNETQTCRCRWRTWRCLFYYDEEPKPHQKIHWPFHNKIHKSFTDKRNVRKLEKIPNKDLWSILGMWWVVPQIHLAHFANVICSGKNIEHSVERFGIVALQRENTVSTKSNNKANSFIPGKTNRIYRKEGKCRAVNVCQVREGDQRILQKSIQKHSLSQRAGYRAIWQFGWIQLCTRAAENGECKWLPGFKG